MGLVAALLGDFAADADPLSHFSVFYIRLICCKKIRSAWHFLSIPRMSVHTYMLNEDYHPTSVIQTDSSPQASSVYPLEAVYRASSIHVLVASFLHYSQH